MNASTNTTKTISNTVADIEEADIFLVCAHIEKSQWQLALKRFFDIVVAATSIILLAPVLLTTIIGVKFSSPGPIFFIQDRVGYQEQNFKFVKFRSMYTDWSSRYPKEHAANSAITGHLHKVDHDPRVTPLGQWLRKFSIDELAQLFNVLNGSMSLIGPRPLMVHMLEVYPMFSKARHHVKPGITGLWQVKDRIHNDHASYMIEHDMEYLKQYSLWLDIKILFKTIPAVLSTKGAF